MMSSDTYNLRRHLNRRSGLLGQRVNSVHVSDRRFHAITQPYILQAPLDPNEAAHGPWWSPFEETMLFVPSGGSSIQLQHLLPSSRPTQPLFLEQNVQNHTRDEEDSKLSKEEQKQSLQKLRRENYKPKFMYTQAAKMVSRVGQFYKGKPVTPDSEYDTNSNAEKCAICLEAFEPMEEVTLTPCSHMFHEDCIVPWVKSHGQCPVCRSLLYHRPQQTYLATLCAAPSTGANDIFSDELMSIVGAMEGGFEWGGD